MLYPVEEVGIDLHDTSKPGGEPLKIMLDGVGHPVVAVPDAHVMFTGAYVRAGLNLVLSGDGRRFLVEDYFAHEERAALMAPNGAVLKGRHVEALATFEHYGAHFAQATAPTASVASSGKPPIGRIEKATGSVTIQHSNGMATEGHVGDQIFEGDVVQTGSDSSAGISFADGSAFSLSANARMVMDKFVFDPNSTSNSALLSIVEGSMSFIAASLAKTGDMQIATPVAIIGIRGTAGGLIASDSGEAKYFLSADPDGHVGQIVLMDANRPGQIIATISTTGVVTVLTPTGPQQYTVQQAPPTPSEAQQIAQMATPVVSVFNLGLQSPLFQGQPNVPAKQPDPSKPDPTQQRDGQNGNDSQHASTASGGSSVNSLGAPSGTAGAVTLSVATALDANGVATTTVTLADGSAQTISGHATTGTAGGTQTVVVQSVDTVINTLVPLAPETPLITISSAGGPTNKAAQTISGIVTDSSVAVVGSVLSIYDNGSVVPIAHAIVGADGRWSVDIVLSVGLHRITVQDTVAGSVPIGALAGTTALTSTGSASVDFDLRTTSPPLAITTSGGLTNQAVHVISGTADTVDAGATVLLFDNGGSAPIATALIGADGKWETTVTFQSSGVHVLTAQETDIYGNTATTGPLTVIYHVVAPTITLKTTGGVTGDAAHVISGTVTAGDSAIGSTVIIYDNGSRIGSATVQSDGSWSTVVTLNVGTNLVSAQDIDAAGNVGISSLIALTYNTHENWINSVSGDWTTDVAWSFGRAPTSSDDAFIDVSGSYSVTIANTETAAVNNLTISAGGASVIVRGSLAVSGLISLQAGALDLDSLGTISGALTASGTGSFAWTGGALLNASYRGVLEISAANSALFIRGGLSVADSSGSFPGRVDVTGSGAVLTFLDTQTFDDAQINLGSIGRAPATLAMSDTTGSGQVLTLGPGVFLNVTGNGELASSGSAGDAIDSSATIDIKAQANLLIDPIAFTSHGGMTIESGGRARISTANWNNFGAVSVRSGGMLQASGRMFNSGTVSLESFNSDLTLLVVAGIFAVQGSGSIQLASSSGGSTQSGVLITGSVSGSFLDNFSNIVGAGRIGTGDGLLRFTNEAGGLVEATSSSADLVLNTGANPVVNAGTLRASLGTLSVLSDLNNSNTIDASGGVVQLLGTLISNQGQLTVEAAGTLRISTANGQHVTFSGLGGTLQLLGTISGGSLPGIAAVGVGAAGVTISGSGNISSTSADAIDVVSDDGEISVVLQGTITGQQAGINVVENGSGNLTVIANGDVTGNNATGILAEQSTSGAGNIVVNGTGNVSAGSANSGIFAEALNAGAGSSITVQQTGSISGGYDGIQSLMLGNGGTTIDTRLTGASANGITRLITGTGHNAIDSVAAGTGSIFIFTDGLDSLTSASSGIDAINTAPVVSQSAGSTIGVTARGAIHTGSTNIDNTNLRPAGILAAYLGGQTDTPNTTAYGNVVLDNFAAILSDGGDGVRAVNDGLGNIAITMEAGGSIGSSAAPVGHYGIGAMDRQSGSIDVSMLGGPVIYSASSGINAVNQATAMSGTQPSHISVVAVGTINSGTVANNSGSNADGIVAGYFGTGNNAPIPNVTGTVSVDNYANIHAAAGGAIVAYTYANGNVTVIDRASTTISGAVYGIQASASGDLSSTVPLSGDITVTVEAGAHIISGSLAGIQAINSNIGQGNTTVTTGIGSTIDSGSSGINAVDEATSLPAGQISVTAAGTISSGTGLSGLGRPPAGINAGFLGSSTAVPTAFVSGLNGDVSVQSSAVITASGGDGVRTFQYGTGDIEVSQTGGSITTAVVSPITGYENGIAAYDYGNGSILIRSGDITAGGNGVSANSNANITDTLSTIEVDQFGTIIAGTQGSAAYNNNGSLSAGVLAGYNYDSTAQANVHGNVMVDVHGSVTSATDGVRAYNYGTGTVSVMVESGASVSGTHYGIGAFGNNAGSVSVVNHGAITGTLGSTAGVNASSSGTGHSTVDNFGIIHGSITSHNATITNEAGALWDFYGTGVLTSQTGSVLTNQGTINLSGAHLSNGGGGISMSNTALIDVMAGSGSVTAGTISGAGAIHIEAGASIEFSTTNTTTGISGQTVTFEGQTGMLRIDHGAAFHSTIAGFHGDGTLSGSDQIDLVDVAYGTSGPTHSFTANQLTVSDGTHTAVLQFSGTYVAANFHFANDGSGGTVIYDPPVASGSPNVSDTGNQSVDAEVAMGVPINGESSYRPGGDLQFRQDAPGLAALHPHNQIALNLDAARDSALATIRSISLGADFPDQDLPGHAPNQVLAALATLAAHATDFPVF